MKIKHWIKIIVFFIVTVIVLLAITVFLTMPHDRDAAGMYGFRLEPEDSLDVILVGPSSIYTAFYSPLAYEKEGFTSYSLAVSAMTGELYKAAIEEALSHQDPDLFIVELWGFSYATQKTETTLRKFLDVLPYNSMARKNAIDTIVPDDLKDSFRNPLLKYHGNWIVFDDCLKVIRDKIEMRQQGFSITKNFATGTYIYEYTGSDDRNYRITEDGMASVDSFLAFCKEKGVENILFIRGPELNNYIPQDSYYEMLDKIEAAGYDFLDIDALQETIGIDPYHDWRDDNHLNIWGTVKFTEFLSRYIVENYDINTEHSKKITEEWDYCSSFNDYMIEYIKKRCEAGENLNRFTQEDLIDVLFKK